MTQAFDGPAHVAAATTAPLSLIHREEAPYPGDSAITRREARGTPMKFSEVLRGAIGYASLSKMRHFQPNVFEPCFRDGEK